MYNVHVACIRAILKMVGKDVNLINSNLLPSLISLLKYLISFSTSVIKTHHCRCKVSRFEYDFIFVFFQVAKSNRIIVIGGGTVGSWLVN